jgi:5-methylcytosine-specific restriction endonuclease McrA
MVFVLDRQERALMPCSEKRARLLLGRRRAVVHCLRPFTIRLRQRSLAESVVQPVVLKLDPGAKVTGIALVREEPTCEGPHQTALHLAELHHKGSLVTRRMRIRAQYRRRRRGANLRCRAPRFHNRCRSVGWLPPSMQSRLDNVVCWARRYRRLVPIVRVELESARFDTQKLLDPELCGVEYQRGELFSYEVWEYLLEKWGRTCAYCGARDLPLERDHIYPKGRGGSDRVSNLTVACRTCNQTKGDRTAEEFGHPKVQARARAPLRAAAASNATRRAIVKALERMGVDVRSWSGGRTKWNRVRLGLPKRHALDALCVGELGRVSGTESPVLCIRAMGRGQHCRTRTNAFGFPVGYSLRRKQIHGFQTGDLGRAVVPQGKHQGVHLGRIVVRASGSFRVGAVDGISWRHCHLLQRGDGYYYTEGKEEVAVSPAPDVGDPTATAGS